MGQHAGKLSFDPTRVAAAAVAVTVATAAAVIQNILAVHRLAAAVSRDPLTGLHNRTVVLTRLRAALGDCRSAALPVAVLFIDLDRFKAVNDTHGHAAGDVLLRELAGRLALVVRGTDTVGRLSGDEFAVVLTGPGSDTRAPSVAERLVAVLSQPVILTGGTTVAVGASVGIAVTSNRETTAETLLQNADTAMYSAKRDRTGPRIRTAEGGVQ